MLVSGGSGGKVPRFSYFLVDGGGGYIWHFTVPSDGFNQFYGIGTFVCERYITGPSIIYAHSVL